MNPVVTSEQRRLAFLILIAPFILNDFGFIAFKGTNSVYLIDYSTRVLVLAICMIWPISHAIAREHHRPQFLWQLPILAIIVLPFASFLFDKLIASPVNKSQDFTVLFQFHRIMDPLFYWFDLSVGLFLVALSEELIFRKFAFSWFKSNGRSPIQIIAISACIFAAMHWSNGLGNIISTFLVGLLFMAFYLKLQRLWPLILAHWIGNFITFGPL